MEIQEQLIIIYQRLTKLREKGFKMKDMAKEVEMPASVLSALYASVLPEFCRLIEEYEFDDALDISLATINNLSKKRLFESIDGLYQYVMRFHDLDTTTSTSTRTSPFITALAQASAASVAQAKNLEGIYMSYSCSSSEATLKAEPFYLTSSLNSSCLTIGRKSVHQSIREGIGIIQERQVLYLMFNAFEEPNMSLATVYLQLPFLEHIRLLKGLFLVLDYNKNPMARRIVLIKQTDEYSKELFESVEARIIPKEEFTDEEQLIYNYTCSKSDAIKMCTLPSPKLDLRDLQAEKTLISKEDYLTE